MKCFLIILNPSHYQSFNYFQDFVFLQDTFQYQEEKKEVLLSEVTIFLNLPSLPVSPKLFYLLREELKEEYEIFFLHIWTIFITRFTGSITIQTAIAPSWLTQSCLVLKILASSAHSLISKHPCYSDSPPSFPTVLWSQINHHLKRRTHAKGSKTIYNCL